MLKLNQQETKLFSNLSSSSEGQVLVSFIEKLEKELVDIRNIPDNDLIVEKKARELAIKILNKEVKDRIRTPQTFPRPEANDYD